MQTHINQSKIPDFPKKVILPKYIHIQYIIYQFVANVYPVPQIHPCNKDDKPERR